MIDYNLALKLKDAGFPQKSSDNDCIYITASESLVDYKIWNGAYVPTLSELIEACGDRFWRIQKNMIIHNGQWSAVSNNPEGAEVANGATPEEAVAKLWLAINERKEK